MPPHRGHLYLVDFARGFTSDITVVVGSLGGEPIPGELRYRWMRELYPNLRIVHLQDENPQTPDQHPDFWEIWRDSLQRVAERPIDLLFASEDYGEPLARTLGASFIPSNSGRTLIPVSGTMVREDPYSHWSFLPPPVQAYYAKRVVLFGPESTGKTTLGLALAQEFSGTFVPEYARTFLRGRGDESKFSPLDLVTVARGQRASEEALARAGRPLLVCDTDPLTTAIWSQELFGEIPAALAHEAEHDNYSLTLLLDVDVPWTAGELRLRREGREHFLVRCREALEVRGREYVLISGTWEQRWERAVAAVRERAFSPRPP